MTDTAIPVLPCGPLDETLAFYEALGFTVTFRQDEPYIYAGVEHAGAHLHLHRLKGLRKGDRPIGMSLIMVEEVEELHAGFVAGLRRTYGQVPLHGTPHIMRMRPGQTRFAITDPSGNTIIFISSREADMDYEWVSAAGDATRSRMAWALDTAINLRDFQYNDEGAARVLDVALARDEPIAMLERARALAVRAELALALGETDRAEAVRTELATLSLSEDEQAAIRDDLEAITSVERLIAGSSAGGSEMNTTS